MSAFFAEEAEEDETFVDGEENKDDDDMSDDGIWRGEKTEMDLEEYNRDNSRGNDEDDDLNDSASEISEDIVHATVNVGKSFSEAWHDLSIAPIDGAINAHIKNILRANAQASGFTDVFHLVVRSITGAISTVEIHPHTSVTFDTAKLLFHTVEKPLAYNGAVYNKKLFVHTADVYKKENHASLHRVVVSKTVAYYGSIIYWRWMEAPAKSSVIFLCDEREEHAMLCREKKVPTMPLTALLTEYPDNNPEQGYFQMSTRLHEYLETINGKKPIKGTKTALLGTWVKSSKPPNGQTQLFPDSSDEESSVDLLAETQEPDPGKHLKPKKRHTPTKVKPIDPAGEAQEPDPFIKLKNNQRQKMGITSAVKRSRTPTTQLIDSGSDEPNIKQVTPKKRRIDPKAAPSSNEDGFSVLVKQLKQGVSHEQALIYATLILGGASHTHASAQALRM